MSGRGRVALQPAFLLHHRDYSDSSRILDLLTRNHGRITLFARGAKRSGSPLRSVLQPFVRLLVSWSGSTDGGTLTAAEADVAPSPLPPARLMSGFYLNELLLRLTPRDEAAEGLFDLYAMTLEALQSDLPEQVALRRFEYRLLEQLGYGLDLTLEAGGGEPVRADRYYHFMPGSGLLAVGGDPAPDGAYRGSELLEIAGEQPFSAGTLRAAKRLLRSALENCLEGRGLKSREVMLALRRLESDK